MKKFLLKTILTLVLTISFNISFSQTYVIDSMKVISKTDTSQKVIVNKYLEFYITYKEDRIEFKRNEEVIYIFKHTSPKLLQKKVKFICYDKMYELLFFQIDEHYITESYKGMTKLYHIKHITKR